MVSHLCRFAVVVAFAGLAGCGKSGPEEGNKASTISGKVTVAGKGPLTGGTIRFASSSAPDKESAATINADGSYQVMDAQPGDYKVSIDNSALPKAAPAGSGAAGMPVPKYMPIDRKYAKTGTSGLSTTVSGSAHTYDVELK